MPRNFMKHPLGEEEPFGFLDGTGYLEDIKQQTLNDLQRLQEETQRDIARMTAIMKPPTWWVGTSQDHCCHCERFTESEEDPGHVEVVIKGFVR